MGATNFPIRARRDDQNGHMVVQQMVEFLRDVVDGFTSLFARGSATVPGGNTLVVVSHSVTAAAYYVGATPLANPGGAWWISNKAVGSFQINLAVAAPVGGVAFDWFVKG